MRAGEAAQAQPVRIGVPNDQSGVYADPLGAVRRYRGTDGVVENAGGTVLGRPIEVIVADHQNKPDVGAAIATRW